MPVSKNGHTVSKANKKYATIWIENIPNSCWFPFLSLKDVLLSLLLDNSKPYRGSEMFVRQNKAFDDNA